MFIDVGLVTDQDVADIYSEQMNRTVYLGDPEFRVMDDLHNPGYSSDYPALRFALRDYPDAEISPRLRRWMSAYEK